jgi:hypothetical protein
MTIKFDPRKSKTPLPDGIRETDLKYPSWKSKDKVARDVGDYGSLTFYETAGFGWCLATLSISRARRSFTTDRTYAVRVSDGKTVRVGAGPHVTRTIQVYVRESRRKALQKYTDLHQQGSVSANTIRDRISSRRAEGAEMRAEGRRSWRWSI